MPEPLSAKLRLVGLLLRLFLKRHGPRARSRRVAGLEVDSYEPRRPRCGPVLLIHGLTLQGGRDPRLVSFARAMARSGVPCLVPTLPALAEGRLHPSDLDLLETLIRTAGEEPLGLVAFSLGASYALRVAARPGVAPHLRSLVSFNAYHDLGPLLDHLLALPLASRDLGTADAALFARLLLARDEHPEQDAFRTALDGYCDRSRAEKERLWDSLPDRTGPALDPRSPRWAALSPAAHLEDLRVPVSLLHDRRDQLVPVAHAQALAQELAPNPDLRVWITEALAHVKPCAAPVPGEWRTMFHCLLPLVH